MNIRTILRKERYKESMHDAFFQILYLGEDFTWGKISASLNDAARLNLKMHRAQSLNELFLILAGGNWHAAAIDIAAWKFQGLHYVDKIRSEYPALPILALYNGSQVDVAAKAKISGASRCVLADQLSPDTLRMAVVSCLAEKKSQLHVVPTPSVRLSAASTGPDSGEYSKNQVISHALNNLLCVITANADVLSEHVAPSGPGPRSLAEIKRAAKSASDLMRLLK